MPCLALQLRRVCRGHSARRLADCGWRHGVTGGGQQGGARCDHPSCGPWWVPCLLLLGGCFLACLRVGGRLLIAQLRAGMEYRGFKSLRRWESGRNIVGDRKQLDLICCPTLCASWPVFLCRPDLEPRQPCAAPNGQASEGEERTPARHLSQGASCPPFMFSRHSHLPSASLPSHLCPVSHSTWAQAAKVSMIKFMLPASHHPSSLATATIHPCRTGVTLTWRLSRELTLSPFLLSRMPIQLGI